MAIYTIEDRLALVSRAQDVLALGQQQLADVANVSRRTITRWYAKHSTPSHFEFERLARAVHPKDAALAASLARAAGSTLEELGLVPPAPPPPPPAPPAPPPRPFPPTRLMAEAVVGVAADRMQCQPSAVRGAIQAAFACARGLGLSITEVDDALSPPAAEAPGGPAEGEPARARVKGRPSRSS
jgi:hypothetical protein